MSKYVELFEYMRQCPELADLWSIGATEDRGIKVILPQGSSETARYVDYFDVEGDYHCDVTPFPSIYEDYQINCYNWYDAKDSSAPTWNENVKSLDEVQAICDWIFEQNKNGNFPEITGEQVVSIECLPRVPQIRYVNEAENTIGYFITVRIRYVNKAQRRSIFYETET